jgi:cytidine deaminase
MTPSSDRLNPEDRDLLEQARGACDQSYSPYSDFAVGAAVRTSDGAVFTGTNVENASYGLSMCAERTAIFKAVTEGHRDLETLAVAGQDGTEASPCGACRQVIREFNPSMTILVSTGTDEVRRTTIEDLLPDSFGPEDL